MKIKILSWNVRGANDRDKKKVIKALIRSQKADLVCLQETKIKSMNIGIVCSLGVASFLDRGVMDVEGAAGGIIVLWDKRVLEIIDMELGLFSISWFKNCVDGFHWMFTRVYGLVVDSSREFFWEELGYVRGLRNIPWCVGGDFNVVRFPCECRKGGRTSSSM